MTPSLEGWTTKAKGASSPHEVRLALVDTNPVFQCLGDRAYSIILTKSRLNQNNNCNIIMGQGRGRDKIPGN